MRHGDAAGVRAGQGGVGRAPVAASGQAAPSGQSAASGQAAPAAGCVEWTWQTVLQPYSVLRPVCQQVPVTSYVCSTETRQVPVNLVRYVPEQKSQTYQVTLCEYVPEQKSQTQTYNYTVCVPEQKTDVPGDALRCVPEQKTETLQPDLLRAGPGAADGPGPDGPAAADPPRT